MSNMYFTFNTANVTDVKQDLRLRVITFSWITIMCKVLNSHTDNKGMDNIQAMLNKVKEDLILGFSKKLIYY
jgi:hypothetical protein